MLARILVVVLSLPLLVGGTYGLCAHYLPGHAATEALSGLVGAGAGLLPASRGAAKALESWLVSPLLRFSVAPVGLVLLFAGLFPTKPTTKKTKQKDKQGKPSEAADGLPKRAPATSTEKRFMKQADAQAKVLAKRGDYLAAANVAFDAESFEKACEYFIEAGEFVRAADIRHDQNRFLEAAELHVRAGRHEAAGSIFSQQGEFVRAAECFLEVGSLSVAAEFFEQGGQVRRAAECYEQAEFLRHAAAAYVKCDAWEKAAHCLEEVYREESLRNKGDSKLQADLIKLARQAGMLYNRAERPEKAMAILERGGRFADAAELAVKLGQHDKAAQLFQDASLPEQAAESLRCLGRTEDAARILGNLHRDRGDAKEAAEFFEEAGDLLAAGDIHRSLEDYARAGTCFERSSEFAQAAEMYVLAGDRANAASCFERAGRPRDAAECHALLGNTEKEAEQLERAGDWLRAGQLYHEAGIDESAITALQGLTPAAEGFSEAAALLGDIFESRGQHSLAVTKLRQAIGDQPMSRESLAMFYSLASSLAKTEDLGEAVEVFEKILGFDYHYKDVEQQLALARERMQVKTTTVPQSGASPAGESGEPARPGRYQIVGELGRGGMGIVFKAKDTSLDRLVAFKVLPDSLQENPQALKNFMREAQSAAKLNHPNIVTVYDTGEQDGRYYIAMEYVDGTTLKEILRRRGAISAAGVLHLLAQICEAMAYAHEKKVVHRDIKTANVMWAKDKKAKLMDFGLAKVVEEVRNHTTVVSGTPYYMSPEQTLGKNVDHRTDIYSLGVTLFELTAGTVPFKEGNIPYHHVHTPPPDIKELQPGVPDVLAGVINRCLRKDPARRFQSAREILDAIRGSVSQTQSTPQD